MSTAGQNALASALRRYLEASSLADATDVLEQHVELLDADLTEHAAG